MNSNLLLKLTAGTTAIAILLMPILSFQAIAGTAPVLDVAPPDSNTPGAIDVVDTNGGYVIIPDAEFPDEATGFVGDGITSVLPETEISNVTITVASGASSTVTVTPVQLAKTVIEQLASRQPMTIASGGETPVTVQLSPSSESTSLTVKGTDKSMQFAGQPQQVDDQVATATALIVAKAGSKITAAGTSIAASGAESSGVVKLMLNFQNLVGDMSIAQAKPQLVASLVPMSIAQTQRMRINVRQLNQSIAAYNQLVLDCPPEALQALSKNSDFQAVGKVLREFKSAIR
jgi:hypothetical protein